MVASGQAHIGLRAAHAAQQLRAGQVPVAQQVGASLTLRLLALVGLPVEQLAQRAWSQIHDGRRGLGRACAVGPGIAAGPTCRRGGSSSLSLVSLLQLRAHKKAA